jgi:initiation factor 1A
MPNLRGGKAYKKSKKSSGNDDDENVVFLRKEKDQMVGRLTKLLGNLNASVFCEDNKTRLCKIAVGIKKSVRFFVGDIVLISLRDCFMSKTDLDKGIRSDLGDIIGKYHPIQYGDLKAQGTNPNLFALVETITQMSNKYASGDVKGAEAIAAAAASSGGDDLFDFDAESEEDGVEVVQQNVTKIEAWRLEMAAAEKKGTLETADINIDDI